MDPRPIFVAQFGWLRSLLGRLLLVAVVLVTTFRARAADTRALVIVLEQPEAGTRLRDALRIQLPSDVVVENDTLTPVASTAQRIRRARALLGERRGLLVLWIEQDSVLEGEREITVYFVGAARDRALVEVVSLRADAVEELERAVAVKAGEVIEALRTQRDPDLLTSFAKHESEPPTREASDQPTRARWSPLVEIIASGSSPVADASGQLGLQAGVGALVRGPRFRVEALGAARVPTAFDVNDPAGELEAREVDIFLSIRASWRSSGIGVGAFANFGARLLSVEGTTAGGARGRVDRTVPMLALGPDLRLELASWLDLRVAGGVELALRRQEFTLNGDSVLDLGRARGSIEVGAVGSLP